MNYISDGHLFTGNIYYYYYVLLLLLIVALAEWEGGPNGMKMIDEQREIQSQPTPNCLCMHSCIAIA